MCHFSFKHNYIFFRIPKCAGSSWIWQNDRCLDWDTDPLIRNGNYTYLEAKAAFKKMGKEDFFNSAEMYARVRRPDTRMKSLFYYLREIEPEHPLKGAANNMSLDDFALYVMNADNKYHQGCFYYLKNEEGGGVDSRIQIERVEDLPKDSLRINVTESETRAEFKPYTLKQIETKYKKDYELWYN